MLTDADIAARVTSAYAQVTFDRDLDTVLSRKPRRRALVPVTALVATTAAVAGAFVALRLAVPVGDSFAIACGQRWTVMSKDIPNLSRIAPPPQFTFVSGERSVRISISEPIAFVCTRAEDGAVTGDIQGSPTGESWLPPDNNRVTYTATMAPSGPEYLIGRVLGGAEQVRAKLQDGTVVFGEVHAGYFALWAPEGGLTGAEVIAARGTEEIRGAEPRLVHGHPSDQMLRSLCFGVAWRPLAYVHDRQTNEPPELPPLRMLLRDGDWALLGYASAQVATACEWTDAGAIQASTVVTANDGSTLQPYQSVSSFARDGGRSWMFGLLPAGTGRAEVRLSDGQVVPARVVGRYFAATWTGGPANPDPVVR